MFPTQPLDTQELTPLQETLTNTFLFSMSTEVLQAKCCLFMVWRMLTKEGGNTIHLYVQRSMNLGISSK